MRLTNKPIVTVLGVAAVLALAGEALADGRYQQSRHDSGNSYSGWGHGSRSYSGWGHGSRSYSGWGHGGRSYSGWGHGGRSYSGWGHGSLSFGSGGYAGHNYGQGYYGRTSPSYYRPAPSYAHSGYSHSRVGSGWSPSWQSCATPRYSSYQSVPPRMTYSARPAGFGSPVRVVVIPARTYSCTPRTYGRSYSSWPGGCR